MSEKSEKEEVFSYQGRKLVNLIKGQGFTLTKIFSDLKMNKQTFYNKLKSPIISEDLVSKIEKIIELDIKSKLLDDVISKVDEAKSIYGKSQDKQIEYSIPFIRYTQMSKDELIDTVINMKEQVIIALREKDDLIHRLHKLEEDQSTSSDAHDRRSGNAGK